MKKNSLSIIGVVVGILLLLGVLIGGSYNSLVTLEEKVNKELSNVDVMLERRADLIPNLVSTVKGYAKHEEKIFNDVVTAREKLLGANTISEKADANAKLDKAIDAMMVIVENYPDLKASQNFIQLSDELAGTENRIATARRDYNEAVEIYNSKRKQFPTVILANMFGFDEKEYFKADDSKTEVPNVEFE